MKPLWKDYLCLHLLLLFNSLGGVCSKLAARQPVFSFYFFLFFGLLLAILMIYSLFWQQVLKRMPLSTAYLNKPVSIVWGIVWGMLFFQERMTAHMAVGAAIVLMGVFIMVWADG